MARKTKDVTVTAEGRDKGKIFRITEKSAVDTEKWCMRVLTAIGRSRSDLPEGAMGVPSSAVMVIGAARALVSMSFDDAEPLIDEMMQCVQIVPDPSKSIVTRPLIPDDTEEVATLLLLRKEVLELHMGFTMDDLKSKATAWIQGVTSSLRIPTSPSPSDTPSPAA